MTIFLGLTKLGTPRLRRPKSFIRAHDEIVRARNRAGARRRRNANIEKGLRHDGKPRKLKRWPMFWSHGRYAKLANDQKEVIRQRVMRNWLKARGLTVYGTSRKYNIWPELKGLAGKTRARAREKIWRFKHRRALMAAGFTTRGRDRMTRQERAWRELRATMPSLTTTWDVMLTTSERGEE